MDNKKIGIILILITVILGIILFNYVGQLEEQGIKDGCFPSENCVEIEKSLNIGHFIFGLLGFLLSLGVYLLLFTKGEEAIVKRLEEEKDKALDNERFIILLKGLDEKDGLALKTIRNQEGITQNTLRLKTDLSKAKLSQVLNSLEKKGLVKKEKKGKTYSIYLNIDF